MNSSSRKNQILAAYLKYLNQGNINKGFTLIELLVTILIIGVLSSIALPSLLSQVDRAKQSEAKVTLSSLNKAQQTYFLERNEFVTDVAEIGKLGVGIKVLTSNYRYNFAPIPGEGGSIIGVAMLANPVTETASYKAYASGIGIAYQAGADSAATLTALCESTEQNQALDASAIAITPGVATTGGGSVECAADTVAVK